MTLTTKRKTPGVGDQDLQYVDVMLRSDWSRGTAQEAEGPELSNLKLPWCQ